MRNYTKIGLSVPQVYLPRKDVDLYKWAVVACDQFTSQPDYWKNVRSIVGDAPSTYHMILPEAFLGKPEEKACLASIEQTMEQYLKDGVLEPYEGMVYVERHVAGKMRKGLIVCLDLEEYDYNKGAESLIRATEGTILDRLPPRIKIRENALLELPHILVLIDDPENRVIEPLSTRKASLQPLYSTDLMLGSGHIDGWLVNDPEIEKSIISALEALADPSVFRQKYNLDGRFPTLLYAMGDGNHSLATAKAIWEKIKPQVGMDHPARFALVELENVHDQGLVFEPIHRVLFGARLDLKAHLEKTFGQAVKIIHVAGQNEMVRLVEGSTPEIQRIGVISENGFDVIELDHPALNLPVGNLQNMLDEILKDNLAECVDYVHGEDVVVDLGQKKGNFGFYLSGMDKNDLFKTVIVDGALPRKTFSMGEAIEKRFYMESRRIK